MMGHYVALAGSLDDSRQEDRMSFTSIHSVAAQRMPALYCGGRRGVQLPLIVLAFYRVSDSSSLAPEPLRLPLVSR